MSEAARDTDKKQKKRAPSLSLQYEYNEAGDILMQDVFVPDNGLATCTYYCCLNWNSGQEGGGYCGIQDHPDGRAFIFSLWNSSSKPETAITASFKGPGTWIEKFGGEGTGLKSMNFELEGLISSKPVTGVTGSIGWKENQWYTFLTRCWNNWHGGTSFGCWVHDQVTDCWTHLITMDYPVPDVSFRGTTVSFLEDWAFTSHKSRCVRYRNGFKRSLNGSWIPFTKAKFQVNTEDTATRNFNAYCPDPREGICIISGGDTQAQVDTSCYFDQQFCTPFPQKSPGFFF